MHVQSCFLKHKIEHFMGWTLAEGRTLCNSCSTKTRQLTWKLLPVS